jgi:hypothetical protein
MLGHITYSSYYKGLLYTDTVSKTYAYLNGQALLRSSYPVLSPYFPEATYGSTVDYIVLPNLATLCWRGLDLGRNADPDAASRVALAGTQPVGDNLGTFQLANMTAHTHTDGRIDTGSPPGVGGGGNISTHNFVGGATRVTDVGSTAISTGLGGTISPSGIMASGNATTSFDVASTTYFPYLGIN